MSETILIANEKGGAGKSATCLLLATCLEKMGYKCLIVDTDPSGNLSAAALPENPDLVLYDVLENPGRIPLSSVICKTDFCDILPTIKDDDPDADYSTETLSLNDLAPRKNLGDAFDKLKTNNGKKPTHQILSLLFQANKLHEFYDFILIDTPPSAGFVISCGIYAADSLLIPCEPNNSSANGIKMIRASILEAQARYGTDIQIDGMVFTRYTGDSATRRNTTNAILGATDYWNIPVYKTMFRVSPPIEQSMNENRPITEYPNGNGLDDSMAFTLEFLAKRGLEPKVVYPGLLRDENGNWIFRKNGSVYFTYTVTDGKAQVTEKRFRLEHLTDEFKAKIGKTVFFSKENLLTYLQENNIPVADSSVT